MTLGRNPRRAYDRQGNEMEPMSLGNLRAQGVRSVWAECESCRHEAVVNVDRFEDAVYVPDVALALRCSKCRSKRITTRPNWTEHKAPGTGRG